MQWFGGRATRTRWGRPILLVQASQSGCAGMEANIVLAG